MNPDRITELASAFYGSAVLFAASDAGVFGALRGGRADTVEGLGACCGLDARGARLLLDACVALGLLTKRGEDYRNSPEAEVFLVPGAPGDLSGAIRYNRDVYAAWGKLPAFVRSGRPVEPPALHLGEDAARTRAFVLAMHGRALGIGRAAVPQLDLRGVRRLLDVGGGPGTFSALLAQAHPGLHSVVIELPAVARIADELLAAQGVADRVRTVHGDYHTTPFPEGCDAVLFSGVLHQESPAAIQDLLARAHAALVPGGRVLVLDLMTDATRAAPAFSALFAVNMALTTEHGWVFSEPDLRTWLSGAGFENFRCRALPPPLPHWLADARKAV